LDYHGVGSVVAPDPLTFSEQCDNILAHKEGAMNRYNPSKKSYHWLTDKYYKGQRLRFDPHPLYVDMYQNNTLPKEIILVDFQPEYVDNIQPPVESFPGYGSIPVEESFPRMIYLTPDGKISALHFSHMKVYK
jgi:hypothetical protein